MNSNQGHSLAFSLREKIWLRHTSRWFEASMEALVPHNFDHHNVIALDKIRSYLQDAGIDVPASWCPDVDFHENMKRWLGACSVPQQTLNGVTPTQPFYLSFFPFVFEVGTALLSTSSETFITRPGFLKYGKTFVIKDDQPQVVEMCMNGIMDRLFGQSDHRYSFVYLVLVNEGGQSNIADMGFEDSGDFWLKMRRGLSHDLVERINNNYAAVTSDRAAHIQGLRIYLASADSHIQLDVENCNGETYLIFRQKELIKDTASTQQSLTPETVKDSTQTTASGNHGPTVYGGKNIAIQTGNNNTQNVTFGGSHKD